MKYLALTLFLCFFTFSLWANDDEIKEIKFGYQRIIYTMEIETPEGEKLYFGLEPLFCENREGWGQYRANARYFGEWLSNTASLLKQGPPKIEALKLTGAVSGEVVEKLQDGHFLDEPRDRIFAGVSYGSLVFDISGGGDKYAAYVSKTPITGGFVFPEDKINPQDYEAYRDAYGDLIMSVGVNLSRPDNVYENRGIFRNPLSTLDQTHKGISMLLHGFVGKVMQTKKQKEFMLVNAAQSMAVVLNKNLHPDEYYDANTLPEHLSWCKEKGGILDTLFVVKVEALAKRIDRKS